MYYPVPAAGLPRKRKPSDVPTTPRYLIAGCGYVGLRLARALLARGPVVGLTGTEASARRR
jgi:hypothetical protein